MTLDAQPGVRQIKVDKAFDTESKMSLSPRTPQAGSYGTDERWEEQPLCLYTLERLYSFSILTARVFAAGNPAHHTAGLAHRCAL